MKNVTNVIPGTKPSIKAAGILKGDGLGGVSAAVPGVDYLDQSAAPSIGANGNWFVGGNDTGILAKAQSSTEIKTITLPASDWVDNQQVVVCDGISADEAKQNITISPALENESLYQDSRVTCISFAENQLTFAADSVPTEDLTVYVAMEQAGEPVANTAYSTEETVVGTWIDGKPIYRLAFVATTGSDTNKDNLLRPASNVDLIVSLYGCLQLASGSRLPLNYSNVKDTSIGGFYSYGLGGFAENHYATSHSNRPIAVIVEYTKTTDTPTIAIPDATALTNAYEEGVNEA